MKHFCLIAFFWCTGFALFAQNGISGFPMPTGYTSSDVRNKNAIVIDGSGNKWIGFANIGLGKFDGTSWTIYNTSNAPMSSNNVRLLGAAGNTIWVSNYSSTSTYELYSFNGTTWANYTSQLNGHQVLAILPLQSNDVWVATNGGIYRYLMGNWINYTVANTGLLSNQITALSYDGAGAVWIGTNRGFMKYDGNWTNYSTAALGLSDTSVVNLYADQYNGLWLNLANHLYKWNGSTVNSVQDFFPCVVDIYAPLSRNIVPGPGGGILFAVSKSLFNINGTTIKQYEYPEELPGYTFIAQDPNSGRVWIINRNGTVNSITNKLFEFDGNNYTDQTIGPDYENSKFLDVNEVRAGILNRGDMHWDLGNSAKYEVPKGGGAGTIFSSALWIGGLDYANNLHMAAMTYRQTGMDFFPGPLDTVTGLTDSATSVKYDHLWKIDRRDIQEFQYYFANGSVQNGSYVPTNDILTWPAHGTGTYAHNLAPFVDVNNNGIYDPLTGGDYPEIRGDQMLYAIFNDALAPHSETGGFPLHIEVHASAYAYECPTVVDSLSAINYTTFYHYDVFNRGLESYHNVHFGVFQDCDLGFYQDDYVGCLPSHNMGFVYNGDSIDGPNSAFTAPYFYGAHPPISSTLILDGPPAVPGDTLDNDNDGIIDEPGEKNLLHSFRFYNSDFTIEGNPQTADEFYYYITDRWKDGSPVTINPVWCCSGPPTQFMFPGIPWQDTLAEPAIGNTPDDRRFLLSCGPFNLDTTGSASLDYAIVYSRDSSLAWGQPSYFNRMLDDERRVRGWFNNQNVPSCTQWNVGISDPKTDAPQLSLYPNPASQLLTLQYAPQSEKAQYSVLDVTGRIVVHGTIALQGQTTLSVENLSRGIYFVRVVDGSIITAKKFIRN